MSRTIRGSKPPGYEYWSRRGDKSKILTHKLERRAADRQVRQELQAKKSPVRL